MTTVPGLIPQVASALSLNTTGNQVTSWAQWNYSGYQGKAAWPEYNDLMTTMARVGAKYGCGRLDYEYTPNIGDMGSNIVEMSFPLWTNGCMDSMEGIYFESSTSTPFRTRRTPKPITTRSAGRRSPSAAGAGRSTTWCSAPPPG